MYSFNKQLKIDKSNEILIIQILIKDKNFNKPDKQKNSLQLNTYLFEYY